MIPLAGGTRPARSALAIAAPSEGELGSKGLAMLGEDPAVVRRPVDHQEHRAGTRIVPGLEPDPPRDRLHVVQPRFARHRRMSFAADDAAVPGALIGGDGEWDLAAHPEGRGDELLEPGQQGELCRVARVDPAGEVLERALQPRGPPCPAEVLGRHMAELGALEPAELRGGHPGAPGSLALADAQGSSGLADLTARGHHESASIVRAEIAGSLSNGHAAIVSCVAYLPLIRAPGPPPGGSRGGRRVRCASAPHRYQMETTLPTGTTGRERQGRETGCSPLVHSWQRRFRSSRECPPGRRRIWRVCMWSALRRIHRRGTEGMNARTR